MYHNLQKSEKRLLGFGSGNEANLRLQNSMHTQTVKWRGER